MHARRTHPRLDPDAGLLPSPRVRRDSLVTKPTPMQSTGTCTLVDDVQAMMASTTLITSWLAHPSFEHAAHTPSGRRNRTVMRQIPRAHPLPSGRSMRATISCPAARQGSAGSDQSVVASVSRALAAAATAAAVVLVASGLGPLPAAMAVPQTSACATESCDGYDYSNRCFGTRVRS